MNTAIQAANKDAFFTVSPLYQKALESQPFDPIVGHSVSFGLFGA